MGGPPDVVQASKARIWPWVTLSQKPHTSRLTKCATTAKDVVELNFAVMAVKRPLLTAAMPYRLRKRTWQCKELNDEMNSLLLPLHLTRARHDKETRTLDDRNLYCKSKKFFKSVLWEGRANGWSVRTGAELMKFSQIFGTFRPWQLHDRQKCKFSRRSFLLS